MMNMTTPGRDRRAACVASRLWILVSETLVLFSCVVCGSKQHFIIRLVQSVSHIHEIVNYRYENGILNPDMGSVFIALDPSVKANGCLQVFSFYHHMCSDSHISLGGITSNTRHIPASYSSVPTFPNNIYRHICYCLSSVKRFYSINSVNSVNSAV